MIRVQFSPGTGIYSPPSPDLLWGLSRTSTIGNEETSPELKEADAWSERIFSHLRNRRSYPKLVYNRQTMGPSMFAGTDKSDLGSHSCNYDLNYCTVALITPFVALLRSPTEMCRKEHLRNFSELQTKHFFSFINATVLGNRLLSWLMRHKFVNNSLRKCVYEIWVHLRLSRLSFQNTTLAVNSGLLSIQVRLFNTGRRYT